MQLHRDKWIFFALVVAAGLGLDVATKRWALAALVPGRTEHVLGGLVPLTLSFNPGIAFGLQLGAASRVVFTIVGLAVLGAAITLYHATPYARRGRCLALALMCAGAVGNLADRMKHPRGVVDFLGPFDLGFMEWPIFNVADILVVVGTLGFALSLWWTRHHDAEAPAVVSPVE